MHFLSAVKTLVCINPIWVYYKLDLSWTNTWNILFTNRLSLSFRCSGIKKFNLLDVCLSLSLYLSSSCLSVYLFVFTGDAEKANWHRVAVHTHHPQQSFWREIFIALFLPHIYCCKNFVTKIYCVKWLYWGWVQRITAFIILVV